MPRTSRTATASRSTARTGSRTGTTASTASRAKARATSGEGLVTAIVSKPRDPSVVEVSVDGTIVGVALRSEVERLSIREGRKLTASLRTKLADACERAAARTIALKALGRSDRSRAALTTLLTERHAISVDAASAAIDELVADGWQDDRRYAEQRARQLAESRPCSQAFVRATLADEGIDERLAQRVAKATTPASGDAERALALGREALRALVGPRGQARGAMLAKARRRVGQLLARRGFDPDTMADVLERLGLASDEATADGAHAE